VDVPRKWTRGDDTRDYVIRAQREQNREARIVLIRHALAHYDGADDPGCPGLAAAARDLGGPAAIREFLQALLDMHRWWP
jgi:hypothetical protein